MTEIVLEFLFNQAGESEGLGDAGIETFRDLPYASCGREAGQNSADAAERYPVRMTFDVIDVPTPQLPGIDVLSSTVSKCLSDADAKKDEKEQDFFKQAQSLLSAPEIKVLRISDYNTKGLVGPSSEEGTPFHSLLKGTGVGSGKKETSGGSFGIGKKASFAVSDLQTVFYSTAYFEDKALRFAAQGKSYMVSHTDADGIKRRATGYWGNSESYTAVEDPARVPEWMQRAEVGTSVFCAGFRQNNGWAWSIAYSLLINFFAALQRNRMAFEINFGEIKLNHNTVAAMFDDERIIAAAEAEGQQGQLDFSRDLFNCLTSPETKVVTQNVRGLGDMCFRILVADNLPKRVGIVRNGMLITSELKHFGDKLQRFAGTKEFVALIEPDADGASKLMKSIENPAHDNFSANRLTDPVKRQQAEDAMKQLARDLRRNVEQAAAISEDDEVILDELARFFAEEATGTPPQDPKAENDPEKYVYKPTRKVKAKAQRLQENSGEIGGAGTSKTRKTGGSRSGEHNGAGAGNGGGTGTLGMTMPIKLQGLRTAIPRDDPSTARRTIWFTPTVSGTAILQLEATGLNSGEKLPLVAASIGSIRNGGAEISLEEGERTCLDVTFDSPYAGPVEVFALAENRETSI